MEEENEAEEQGGGAGFNPEVLRSYLLFARAALKARRGVMAVLAVSVQSRLKLAVGLVAGVYLGLNVFVNYFTHRKEIRQEVWGGAPLEERIDVTLDVVREFSWFDPDNRAQAAAFDARLNQNYFAGLAAARIEQGSVDYLYGRSVWEGMIALVPRAMWPEKPVFAGSPKIVAEMTGLRLNENTSFGVGNVMEFQINFGTPGVIGGFFILGLLIRLCDRTAAVAVRRQRQVMAAVQRERQHAMRTEVGDAAEEGQGHALTPAVRSRPFWHLRPGRPRMRA